MTLIFACTFAWSGCVTDVPLGSLDGAAEAGDASVCLATAMQCVQPSDCCSGLCVQNPTLRLQQCQ